MSRALRCDHDDIQVLCRFYKLEVNVETMRECERIAFLHMRSDQVVIRIRSLLIRYQHHYDIASFRCAFDIHYFEVVMCFREFRSLFPMCASFAQTNNDINAAFCQVFGMGMSLGTEADNSYCLSIKNAEVAVRIIILFNRHEFFSFFLIRDSMP